MTCGLSFIPVSRKWALPRQLLASTFFRQSKQMQYHHREDVLRLSHLPKPSSLSTHSRDPAMSAYYYSKDVEPSSSPISNTLAQSGVLSNLTFIICVLRIFSLPKKGYYPRYHKSCQHQCGNARHDGYPSLLVLREQDRRRSPYSVTRRCLAFLTLPFWFNSN